MHKLINKAAEIYKCSPTAILQKESKSSSRTDHSTKLCLVCMYTVLTCNTGTYMYKYQGVQTFYNYTVAWNKDVVLYWTSVSFTKPIHLTITV